VPVLEGLAAGEARALLDHELFPFLVGGLVREQAGGQLGGVLEVTARRAVDRAGGRGTAVVAAARDGGGRRATTGEETQGQARENREDFHAATIRPGGPPGSSKNGLSPV